MERLRKIESLAAPLLQPNIDTDTISPMYAITRAGASGLFESLATYAFAPLKYVDGDADAGELNPDFVLNQRRYAGAKILITGENFGCGSSRETAPAGIYALGVRCLIGTSFGDIFFGNCFQRGVLPICLSRSEWKLCIAQSAEGGFVVDLDAQSIRLPGGRVIGFSIDSYRKHCLVNGLDDIGSTLQKLSEIQGFQSKDRHARPWIY